MPAPNTALSPLLPKAGPILLAGLFEKSGFEIGDALLGDRRPLQPAASSRSWSERCCRCRECPGRPVAARPARPGRTPRLTAKYWLHVFTELKNRGLDDVLMLVCDGLKGLPEAVETIWPRTIVQTCVVHLLRNSFRYAARQDWDKVAGALKRVYTAPSEDAATERFLEFQESWGRKYPAIVKLWSDAWAEFVPFLLRRRDTQGRLQHERDRERQRTHPQVRPRPRALPPRGRALKCIYMA